MNPEWYVRQDAPTIRVEAEARVSPSCQELHWKGSQQINELHQVCMTGILSVMVGIGTIKKSLSFQKIPKLVYARLSRARIQHQIRETHHCTEIPYIHRV